MDFTGYYEFPFPSSISQKESKIKDYFYSLSDEIQLRLLNSSHSYENFYGLVCSHMEQQLK